MNCWASIVLLTFLVSRLRSAPRCINPQHRDTCPFHPQAQECIEKFQELKTGKKLAYVVYGISDDKKSIIVLKTSPNRDFEEFIAELPEKECRWAIYDFQYELPGGEGIRNKLVFVQW
jgi:hypothetical protein